MLLVIPHFANECLTMINSNTFNWPNFDENILKDEISNIVIQINGKKEDLFKLRQTYQKKSYLIQY